MQSLALFALLALCVAVSQGQVDEAVPELQALSNGTFVLSVPRDQQVLVGYHGDSLAEHTDLVKVLAMAKAYTDNVAQGIDDTVLDILQRLEALESFRVTSANNVETLQGQMEAAESTVSALQDRNISLSAMTASLEDRVSTNEGHIGALGGSNASLAHAVSVLDMRATDMESKVAALETSNTTVANVLDALDGRVVDNTEGIADLVGKYNSVDATVGSLQGTVGTHGDKLANHTGKLTALDSTVVTHASVVADLRTDLDAEVSRATDAEGSLATDVLALEQDHSDHTLLTASQAQTLTNKIDDGLLAATNARSGLSERITTVRADVDTVTGRATTLEGRATSIEVAAGILEGRVTSVEGVASSAASTAGKATSDLSALTTRVTTVEGVAGGAASTAGNAKSDIAALATRVSTVEGVAAGAASTAGQATSGLSTLTTRVSTAEGSLASTTSKANSAFNTATSANTVAGKLKDDHEQRIEYIGQWNVAAEVNDYINSNWRRVSHTGIGFTFGSFNQYKTDMVTGTPKKIMVRQCVTYSDSGTHQDQLTLRITLHTNVNTVYAEDSFRNTWSGSGLAHHECGTWFPSSDLSACTYSWSSTCQVALKVNDGYNVDLREYHLEVAAFPQ
eukprot:m.478811 g.478811  ORF g.478811 m.478811 type:complete len:625 (+) comp21236_c0_seq1:253-2127(+)